MVRKANYSNASIRLLLAIVVLAHVAIVTRAQIDPLVSWNDGAVKRSIVSFVSQAVREGGPGYIPAAERIATFDNDGTLWTEKPVPTEIFFAFALAREMAEKDPSLKTKQPFKAVVENDMSLFQGEAGEKKLLELIASTHSGMTQEEFSESARKFIAGNHPKLGRAYSATAYKPMLELLAYLRANGFDVWISSGGTVDFMRAFAPRMYGVQVDQIVGTEFKRESRVIDGKLHVWRLPALEHFNDKEGKPVGIDRQIGMRPAFVGGNVFSGGDIAMMRYSKGRNGPSFQLLVNHDDAEREFAYEEKDNYSLSAAKTYGFTVVSMKRDWKAIFPAASTAATR